MAIGFFTPLPLAYMIPFMQAQSLAMGEAFGKGFQYGKRKISAMTNEDFNKYTFQSMVEDANANMNSIIPSLHQQLQTSENLQKDIFKHMFALIPLFINEVAKSTNDFLGNLFGQGNFAGTPTTISASPPPAITEISDYTPTEDIPIIQDETKQYSQAIFRAMSMEELVKGINSGRFTGSDLSLANHVLKERQTTDTTLIPTEQTASGKDFQNYIDYNVYWLQRFIKHVPKAREGVASALNIVREAKSKLIASSRRYRDPNNAIRREALSLKAKIANGLLDI